MKKVEILICSEQGFRATWGAGQMGAYVYMISTVVQKREKKGRKIHIFNNLRYKNEPLLLTNENLFGKDSAIR